MVESKCSKRVRTGCRQCRTRRRKCDEEKPKCRNCVARGTSCEYGPLLTFLSKNAYTVRQPSRRSGPSRIRDGDGNEERGLQFVNLASSPTSEKSKSPAGRMEDRDQMEISIYEDTYSTHQHYKKDQNSGKEDTDFYQDPNERTPAVNEQEKDNGTESISQTLSPFSRWPTRVDRRPSDGDRSAVQGLLALGLVTSTASPSLLSADLSPAKILSSPMGIDGWNLSAESPEIDSRPKRTPGFFGHSLEPKSLNSVNCQHFISRESGFPVKDLLHEPSNLLHPTNNQTPLSTAEEIPLDEWKKAKLLRHYRYEVATWLDICDTNQSFGIAAPQLALGTAPFGPSSNPAALSAIISLAEMSHFRLKSSESFFDHISPNVSIFENSTPTPILEQRCPRVDDLSPGNSDSQIGSRALSSALCATLEKVKQTVSNFYRAWTRTGTGVDHLDLVGSLVPYASEKSLRSALYWLLLRLDLSASLINPSANIAAISMSFTLRTDEFENTDDTGHKSFQYAHIPLIWCAQAIVLCDDTTNTRSPKFNSTESWMRLINKLNEWYLGRPSEFRPMFELDAQPDDDSNFPALLFTNGAAIFGNQLYHTAMHLLLQKKPRTANLTHLSPAARSSLWHIRRICGIALHNDRRQCWDLTLLASFFVAVTNMTYKTQQMEIVHGFHRIQKITGWNIGDLVTALQSKWSTMEDV